MSDFLTNLVARSFTPAPDLLRPKLPSLFETPAGNEPVLEESLSTHAQGEMAEVAPVLSPVRRSNLERYRVDENERGRSLQTEPERETPETYRAARQTILPFLPEEQPRAPIQTQREEHIRAVPTVRAEDSSGERKQATGPRLEAATRSAKESDESKSIQQGTAARLVPVLPKLETPRPISESKNSMDAKISSAEERSPTVHIRIGRIEVRAATQSSPPARAAVPNRPKMTLDEYLLRRNEGKR
jgi:hypothetical protein